MPPRPPYDRIVAVGLLTQRDLDVLGTGFRRLYPIQDSGTFDDLLKEIDRLDRATAEPASP